ncbi:MAG: hypothetical protein WBC66_10790, partial [Candidatus Acidiferrales bacterium]
VESRCFQLELGQLPVASVVVLGGVLLAVSPTKFQSIQKSLMRVPPEGRRYLYSESGLQIRIVGVLIALVGIGMILGPVSAMLSGEKLMAARQPALVRAHSSPGLLLGFSALVIVGLFTAVKPKSAWKFFSRTQSKDEMISR